LRHAVFEHEVTIAAALSGSSRGAGRATSVWGMFDRARDVGVLVVLRAKRLDDDDVAVDDRGLRLLSVTVLVMRAASGLEARRVQDASPWPP
jgi:hypothetical protein